jgi:surface antigen
MILTVKKWLLIVPLTAALGMSACTQSTGPKQGIGALTGAVAGGLLGNQVGAGEGRVAATAIGAVIGAAVGSEIGRALDENDQRRLYAAQTRALESGRSGSRAEWRNPDSGNYGYVVPGPAYSVNNTNCRDYTHTIFIDGSPQTARGTACREPDGSWRVVS